MRQIVVTVILAIVFAAGIWLGFKAARWTKAGSGLHQENTPTVVQQVQALSELVTVKYVVEKVIVLEDAKWYGQNRVLLLAHGIVKAGIDLKRIQPDDVKISGKKIIIVLPLPELTDAYLDERQTRVIDNTTGLLRTFDKDLETTARQNAVMDIRRAAVENGILKDASERAQLELAVFLNKAGFEQVEFSGQTNWPREKMP